MLAFLTAGLLLSAPALAAQERLPLEKSRTATGTIAFIQKETRQFVLKADDGTNYVFAMDERSSIRDRDKDVRLLDMGEGSKVTVTYLPSNDRFYAVSVVSEGKRTNDTTLVPEKPREASPIDAEPITVKGKIENVKSDLSEVTVKTFDDKVLTFAVDEDTRTRFKNHVGAVPNLNPGSEVTAVYLIQNGRNRLVTLSDLIQPTPSTGAGSSVTPNNSSGTVTRNNTTNNGTMIPNQPNVNVQAGNAGLPFGGLPLIGGAVLPGGFTSTTNNVAGSLNGSIAQVQRDMLFLTTTPVVDARNNQNGNRNGTNQNNNQGTQTGGTSFVPQRPDLFAVVAVNSKEPFILDGSTRILLNNQNIRWQDLREGSMIQAHFNVSTDGSKVVHTIIVMDNRAGTNNAAQPPTNPNNRSGVTDQNGNPTQPNQTGGQQGRGIPPAGQFPPLPNQTGNASNANPASATGAGSNAANIVSGRIARMKFDSLYLQRSGNDYSFLTTRNSVEPLRIDNGTRFLVNNQEARFTDLQAGMQAQVFVEFVNNVRRVVGISANSQNVVQTGGRNP